MNLGTPLLQRFWSKVDVLGPDCWEWQASLKDPNGPDTYGSFQLAKAKSTRAHRMAWELFHGPIPGGACVLHRCDNKRCVRPSHLYLGTRTDNMRDTYARGQNRAMKISHCRQGHPYEQQPGLGVHRTCRQCQREAERRYRARKRGQA